jgi:hypothetical protein
MYMTRQVGNGERQPVWISLAKVHKWARLPVFQARRHGTASLSVRWTNTLLVRYSPHETLNDIPLAGVCYDA